MAPDFTLPDQDEKLHNLSYYRGSFVLIYFYPKDDTSGCTSEANAIKDIFTEFGENNISVLGISSDSPESHKRFKEKYGLPFDLLSDKNRQAIKPYGANRGPFTRRISYLVGPDGKILKTYEKVDPKKHAAEVIADFTNLVK